ncbi:flagellar filament capping protein FliD [Gracilibacillus alcaliphilus]|uniref:flagellar filament capping protein FliD n=1 Tax=Gracilibacillus alcaliphilus TaxID=1401441 RepID=UPI00195A6733|nr:flagellar filament capping protein FliD [Gracilibacillus alcaliphilus]MBM7676001.1 flagellar hook-associated protein 2 [Gracilibacillus alcaliphilus]
MRITGLASGMDIEQMVKDLMRAESMPLQRLEQQKKALEWKRDDYRSMNTLLLDFRNKLAEMTRPSTYRARQTSSTNEAFISAIANSAASQSSFEISEVSQLAKSASWINGGAVADKDFDASKSLINQNFTEGMEWKQGAIHSSSQLATANNQSFTLETDGNIDVDSVNVRLNGKGYEVVTGIDSSELKSNQVLLEGNEIKFADGAVKERDSVHIEYASTGRNQDKRTLTADETTSINLSGQSIVADDFSLTITPANEDGEPTTYKLLASSENDGVYQLVEDGNESNVIGNVNVSTGRVTFQEPLAKETTIEANYQQNYASFGIGANTSKGETYQNFIIRGSDSLNQVVSRVNNADVGVSLTFDSFTNQLSMRRTETGIFADNGEDIRLKGAFLNETLRFGETNMQAGQNAKFTINGLSTERTTNNFQMDGVTFQLKQTFTETDGAVTVNVTNDSEAVFDRIKEFVDTYNTLIEAINTKINEPFHRDYEAPTEEERESLSDKQLEEWEEMAKSGLLRRDPLLQDVLTQMRRDFYSPVSGAEGSAFSQLVQIGITTTRDYMDGGKLEIDEAKLKQAIEEDPTAVENLFRGDGTSYEGQGIARRLTDSVNQSMDRIYERAGRASYTDNQFTIGRNLSDMEKRIEAFQRRLDQVEQRYWKQFTAMETAMQQANNQMAYMMQQFGGMGMA